jgi:hypothetical protein
VTANGGAGGAGSNGLGGTHAGGLGATTGVGTTIRSGGNGSLGTDANPGYTGTGGGGAGSGGNGVTPGNACGVTGTGGAGVYPGGNGGYNTNCNITTNLGGVSGAAPGGGGSGDNCWTSSFSGGAGGAGKVVLVYTVVLNTITTSNTISTPLCAGAAVSVPYTIAGTYNAGNVFTAQLSDAAGSFAAPTSIGTLNSQLAGTIAATIPAGAGTGAGYLIRVISSNPAITGSNSNVIAINALPVVAAIAGGAATVCVGNTTAAFTDVTVGGVWSRTNGTGSATISAGGIVTGVTVGTVTVNYTVTVSGCSTTVTTPITVTDVPAAAGVITGVTPVCPGQNGVAFSVAAIAGATGYTWSYSGTGETISGSTAAITINFSGTATSGNLTVKGTNACGGGTASANYSITVSSTPAAPGIITGIVNQTPATGGQIYSIAPIAGATTYTWTVPAGWTVTGGAGTNSITVTTGGIGANGNITVTAGNACGTSTAQILAVFVSTASPNAGPDQYLCNGTSTATMAASPAGGTWTCISGPVGYTITTVGSATTTITTLGVGTYVFRWTIGGAYDDILIVRSP